MIIGQAVNVKPKAGLPIRKENGQLLAEDGELVIASAYWARRLNEGDIVEVAAESPKTKG